MNLKSLMTILTVFLTTFILITSCGSTEETTEIESSGPSSDRADAAIENCKRLLSNYCLVVESCTWFTSKDECLTELRQEIDCSDAVDFDEDIDVCFDDLAAIDCDASPGLPASCSGVITIGN